MTRYRAALICELVLLSFFSVFTADRPKRRLTPATNVPGGWKIVRGEYKTSMHEKHRTWKRSNFRYWPLTMRKERKSACFPCVKPDPFAATIKSAECTRRASHLFYYIIFFDRYRPRMCRNILTIVYSESTINSWNYSECGIIGIRKAVYLFKNVDI